MESTSLTAIIGLLVALSVATERLVEIVKGIIKPLTGKSQEPMKEGFRRAWNQVLAVVAGIVTAFLAKPAIPDDVLPATNGLTIVALGLLASGGSGFWNSVLSYFMELKDLKEAQARQSRDAAQLPTTKWS